MRYTSRPAAVDKKHFWCFTIKKLGATYVSAVHKQVQFALFSMQKFLQKWFEDRDKHSNRAVNFEKFKFWMKIKNWLHPL